MAVKGIYWQLAKRKARRRRGIERRDENTTIPDPISASVSQYWEGNDGPWSSFAIQVGKKSQNVRVLPSTASSSTWVVYEAGCPSDAPKNCLESRGGTFNSNFSLTWAPNSIFELGLEENLGYSVFGDFGYDTVTLGWQGSNGPSVEHTIVAGIADTSFSWLGVVGLNPRPTNFSTHPNNPQVSFVQALRNQNSIPSLSWAYTAGAPYRLDKVYGSLTLGGYDQSRFTRPSSTAPDLTFPFHTDISRDLLVGISSVTTSKTTSSPSDTKLLNDGIFAFIDSTVPHLWLPESVCNAFERAFGLTWNSTTELYTLNASHHLTLSSLNPTITFNLSPDLSTSRTDKSVSIALPYSAFDLNVSWPHAKSSTYYFPLKRAANDTQYTLGRAFLQEAYIIADYERQNFSVWPCKWDSDTTKANILPIFSRDVRTNSSAPNIAASNRKRIGAGTIAGIAVGGATVLIAVAIIIWLRFLRKRTKSPTSTELDTCPSPKLQNIGVLELSSHDNKDPNELDSKPQLELDSKPQLELDSNPQHELDSNPKHELDSNPKHELQDTRSTPWGLKCGINNAQALVEVEGTERREVYEMDGKSYITSPRAIMRPGMVTPNADEAT